MYHLGPVCVSAAVIKFVTTAKEMTRYDAALMEQYKPILVEPYASSEHEAHVQYYKKKWTSMTSKDRKANIFYFICDCTKARDDSVVELLFNGWQRQLCYLRTTSVLSDAEMERTGYVIQGFIHYESTPRLGRAAFDIGMGMQNGNGQIQRNAN